VNVNLIALSILLLVAHIYTDRKKLRRKTLVTGLRKSAHHRLKLINHSCLSMIFWAS